MFAFLYVKANFKEICEETSFSYFFRKILEIKYTNFLNQKIISQITRTNFGNQKSNGQTLEMKNQFRNQTKKKFKSKNQFREIKRTNFGDQTASTAGAIAGTIN